MNETDRPHLPHVPTLTEVIEPLHLDTDAAPDTAPASADEPPHMIVTRNLPEKKGGTPDWVPLKTLVLPTHPDGEAPASELGQPPVDLSDVPLLSDPVLTSEVVASMPAQPAELTHEQLVQRVMVDVQRRVDSMLEFRLREALTPILARHTEALIRDMRDELSLTMRDVVTRSVAHELAKLRPR